MILGTGVHGFIGRSLVEYLMRAGSRIRILTRSGSCNLQGIGGQVDVRQGDLTVANSISGIAETEGTMFFTILLQRVYF